MYNRESPGRPVYYPLILGSMAPSLPGILDGVQCFKLLESSRLNYLWQEMRLARHVE